MKKTMKQKLAHSLSGNIELNKKMLRMKKSWEEVEKLIKTPEAPKKKK